MQVDIYCPLCQLHEITQVPDYLLKKTESGVVAIQIVMKSNCKHSFVVYIDQYGDVRGYQVLDYQIELGEPEKDIPLGRRPLTLNEVHSLIGIAALGHILAALVTQKKVFLVGDEIKAVAIAEFFDRILPKPAPVGALQPISKSEYMTKRVKEETVVTLDLATRAILGTPFKAKEIEWFCGPIAMALDIPETRTAESFLKQEYLRIWNLMNIFHHLIDRGLQKENSSEEQSQNH